MKMKNKEMGKVWSNTHINDANSNDIRKYIVGNNKQILSKLNHNIKCNQIKKSQS